MTKIENIENDISLMIENIVVEQVSYLVRKSATLRELKDSEYIIVDDILTNDEGVFITFQMNWDIKTPIGDYYFVASSETLDSDDWDWELA